MRTVEALRFLHGVYRRHPVPDRVRILVRFFTCPFLRMLGDLPRAGRILEIGAGHGLFGYLAASEPARRVVALEPDLRKSVGPPHAPGVRWVAGFDDSIRGSFDAVAMLDVAYRLTLEERTALYRRVFERLRPGGVFLLKEMDPDRRWKMAWNRAQEWVSDTFLQLTLGSGFVYQRRDEVERTLRALGFEEVDARDLGRGYPHPHLLFTARRPRA